MLKVVKKIVDVNEYYCDYCGQKMRGYEKCDVCGKHMCLKHTHIMSNEENHYCQECGDKKRAKLGLARC